MRYVIKSTQGYFTEMKPVGSRNVTLHGQVIAQEILYKPAFQAFMPEQSVHFDTESDAQEQIAKNLEYCGGPEAFSNCTVEPTET